MRSFASGRFVLRRKLGAGSFGEIYAGEDTKTGEKVAIKLEPVKTRFPQLSYESKLYMIFANGVSVPKLHWFGTEASHNAMVIDLLGKSLEDLASECHHRLSLKTVLMLADQMLSAVEYLHSINFIHRDIKPDNFVMGLGPRANQVFIIDFGLSKKYRDPHTHQHIPYVENKDLTGTARYASVAALKGIEQSRRDDLEALGFVWMYLLKGTLPWMGLEAKTRKQKYENICRVKASTSFEDLCAGYPEEFVTYFKSVRQLRFADQPDYSRYRKMFKKLFLRLGYVYDYRYDWVDKEPTERHTPREERHVHKECLSDRAKKVVPKPAPVRKRPKSKKARQDEAMLARGNLSTAVQKSHRGESMERIQGQSEAHVGMRYRIPQPDEDDGIFRGPARMGVGRTEAEQGFRIPIPSPRSKGRLGKGVLRGKMASEVPKADPVEMRSSPGSDDRQMPKRSVSSPVMESREDEVKRRRRDRTQNSGRAQRSREIQHSHSKDDAKGKWVSSLDEVVSDSDYDEFVEMRASRDKKEKDPGQDISPRKKENYELDYVQRKAGITDVEDIRPRPTRPIMDRYIGSPRRRQESEAATPTPKPRMNAKKVIWGQRNSCRVTSAIPSWMIDKVRNTRK